MKPCPPVENIQALRSADDTLSESDRIALWNHVADCEACSDHFLNGDSSSPRAPVQTEATLRELLLEQQSTLDTRQEGVSDVLLPGYEILEEIGYGGCARVYRARQQSLDRTVAIKLLNVSSVFTGKICERFQKEMLVTAALTDTHIVQIHDRGDLKGRHWAVMELLPTSLGRHWDRKPQPPRDVARLVRTLAVTMAKVHEKGVVHRDLKPANVLLDAEGTPKITDFGFALLVSSETMGKAEPLSYDGNILGTPAYMPPEQAIGKNQAAIDHRADIYALGATMYEGLTGRPPFLGESHFEVIQQVLDAEPIPPRRLTPTVPRDLELICLKCLEKEPHRRFRTATELAEELQRFLDDKPIWAKPTSRREQLWRLCRKHKLISGFAILFLALLGVSLWGWSNARQVGVEAEKREQAERVGHGETIQRADAEKALRLQAEKAKHAEEHKRIQEILQRGDSLAQLGTWRDALDVYQGVLHKELPQLASPIDETERLRLRLKILRASLFLDDLVFVEQELLRLEQEPLGSLIGTWRFDKAAYASLHLKTGEPLFSGCQLRPSAVSGVD